MNDMGFIETPYRKVEEGKVTGELTQFAKEKLLLKTRNSVSD